VAVASAGPYASLHLAPDRQPRQHPTAQFLQAGCPSCRPTNSVKALKANVHNTRPLNLLSSMGLKNEWITTSKKNDRMRDVVICDGILEQVVRLQC